MAHCVLCQRRLLLAAECDNWEMWVQGCDGETMWFIRSEGERQVSSMWKHHPQYIGACKLGGPGSSRGKVLDYGLDGLGSILGVGGVEIFLRSFVSRLVLGSTQPPIKAAERRLPYLFLVPWLCICGLLHPHPPWAFLLVFTVLLQKKDTVCSRASLFLSSLFHCFMS